LRRHVRQADSPSEPGHAAVRRHRGAVVKTGGHHAQDQPSGRRVPARIAAGRGQVTISPGSLNDTMKVSIHGMPAHAGFDLFVIQQPLAPFGVSWYQTDVNAGSSGTGSATVRGVFDVETFSASPGAPRRSPRRTSTTWGCGSAIPPPRSSSAASRGPSRR
jgi:hypothetical protein